MNLQVVSTNRCPLCDYFWNDSADFYRHIEENHDENVVNVCKTCNQIFSRDDVEIHTMRCKGTHVCHECRATFAQNTYLQRHIKRKHSYSNERPICDECKKSFSSPQALSIHRRLHTGEMPYACEHCKMRFNQPIHLQQHRESRHSSLEQKPKPFRCERCDRSFQLRSSLLYHNKLFHEISDNAFQCRLCDKIFPYLSDLKRHLAVHLPKDSRLYSCELCLKSYKEKRQLNAHIKVHLNPALFTCPFCNKCYSSRSYLESHISHKHSSSKKPRGSVEDEELSSDEYLIEFADLFWSSSPQVSDEQLDANVKILKDCFLGNKKDAPTESNLAIESILGLNDDIALGCSLPTAVSFGEFEDLNEVDDEPPTIESKVLKSSDDSMEVDFLSESP